jgi:CRP-like cAMP-binding protein
MEKPNPFVYFPMAGVCSVTIVGRDGGDPIQVGIIGCEGVTAVLGTYSEVPDVQLRVELPASILRVPREDFESEMSAHLTLRRIVRVFYRAFNGELMLSVACNRRHSLRSRFCRRILELSDRLASDDLRLNHATLAAMLGTTRPSVTVMCLEFKRTGVISYTRSAFRITDRTRLEAGACECYATVHRRLARLLPPRA